MSDATKHGHSTRALPPQGAVSVDDASEPADTQLDAGMTPNQSPEKKKLKKSEDRLSFFHTCKLGRSIDMISNLGRVLTLKCHKHTSSQKHAVPIAAPGKNHCES
jgi:hypothetical protein